MKLQRGQVSECKFLSQGSSGNLDIRCVLMPADMKPSHELSMSLVLKEAGPTISVFQVHTLYCALS